jgi:hypothetical protein
MCSNRKIILAFICSKYFEYYVPGARLEQTELPVGRQGHCGRMGCESIGRGALKVVHSWKPFSCLLLLLLLLILLL